MTKITKKEMFEILAKFFTANDEVQLTENVNSAMVVEFAEKEKAALEAKAVKAKERAASKKTEGDALRETVRLTLSETEFQTIAQITEKIGDEDVTTAKVTNRLSNLVKAGLAESTEVTVGETGAKRKIKAYRALPIED